MILTGIGDEAGNTIDAQIAATKELGWHNLEMRGVEVPGFPKSNFHDIPDKAFDIATEKLQAAGIVVEPVTGRPAGRYGGRHGPTPSRRAG